MAVAADCGLMEAGRREGGTSQSQTRIDGLYNGPKIDGLMQASSQVFQVSKYPINVLCRA
jgi:hypothetical protein